MEKYLEMWVKHVLQERTDTFEEINDHWEQKDSDLGKVTERERL